MSHTLSYLSLIGSLVLVSCASVPPTCPKTTPGQCKSMGEVNALVDQGVFDEKIGIKKTKRPAKKNSKGRVHFPKDDPTSQTDFIAEIDDPKRQPETVLKIWFAAYEDAAGNYVSAHTVFTVVQPAYWQGDPTSIARIAEEALLNPSLVADNA